jgi:hypothetical protein
VAPSPGLLEKTRRWAQHVTQARESLGPAQANALMADRLARVTKADMVLKVSAVVRAHSLPQLLPLMLIYTAVAGSVRPRSTPTSPISSRTQIF